MLPGVSTMSADMEVPCCAAGVVEASVRKLGQRTKAILKKGHCFGEKAILAGESAQDTCITGSTLVVLSVPK